MATTGTKQGLASIGIKVTVDRKKLNYVTGIGDIGGEPNMLDATCLTDKMTVNVPGVQKNDGFNIDYLYDNTVDTSDYKVLKAMEGMGTKEVVITFPDGTTFSNSGYVSTKINGAKVNELISASATISLQGDWEEGKETAQAAG